MTRRRAFRVCQECDGDRVVVSRMVYDEHRGAVSYETVPCPGCGGEGYVAIPPRSLRRGMVVARLVIAFLVAIALLVYAASRPGQQTTVRVDLSPVWSAVAQSTGPRHRIEAGRLPRLVAGRGSVPSPAVASGAASGGLSGPTASMSASLS
jgi:hypothetical protein